MTASWLLFCSAWLFFVIGGCWFAAGPTSPLMVTPFLMGIGFLWLSLEAQREAKKGAPKK